MTLRQFYDWQTWGGAKDVMPSVAAREEPEISWCIMAGLAVNHHWAEGPMATADVDLLIASEKTEKAVNALKPLGLPSRAVPIEVPGILMPPRSTSRPSKGNPAENPYKTRNLKF